jgi:HK97 family phage major capsid protein
MPNMATDSYSVAFGDFRRGYLIVDRVGIRVLRDPYSSKPYVLFYTTKRVGGGVETPPSAPQDSRRRGVPPPGQTCGNRQ